MTGIFLPTAGPGDGLFPADYIVEATNRTGTATVLGDIVMFDMLQGATEVDNATPGSSDADGNNSAYNNFVVPLITGFMSRAFPHGICLEGIADNASGRVLIRGRVTASVATLTDTGDALVAAADHEMVIADGTTDQRIMAIAESADTANLAPVLFDGINGFGEDTATA